jgi:hypothetical protein
LRWLLGVIDKNADNINVFYQYRIIKTQTIRYLQGKFIKNEDPYFLVIRQFIAIEALANHTRINDRFLLYDAHDGPIDFFIAEG